MRQFFVGAGLVVLLAGCAQNVWVRPGGVSEAQFQSDRFACERDSRQSGYFGTGLAGAIEIQQFFNRCMNAKGYSLQDREVAQANTTQNRGTIERAVAERRACIQRLRDRSEYAVLLPYLSDMATARFSFTQMANAAIPTPAQASVYARYVDVAKAECSVPFLQAVRPMLSPQQLQAMEASWSEADSVAAQLARRQMTWGEFASRSNQVNDALAARMRGS